MATVTLQGFFAWLNANNVPVHVSEEKRAEYWKRYCADVRRAPEQSGPAARLRAGLKRDELNEIQRKAVADELVEKGIIRRDEMYRVGLPACGRIKNVGGRIHELRKLGWMIETEKDAQTGECIYRFVSKPIG